RRGGVGPCIVQRTEGGIGCTNGSQRVQQIAGRAREPVQPGHDHRITVIRLSQQPRQLLAVRPCAADLFLKDPLATGRLASRPSTSPPRHRVVSEKRVLRRPSLPHLSPPVCLVSWIALAAGACLHSSEEKPLYPHCDSLSL